MPQFICCECQNVLKRAQIARHRHYSFDCVDCGVTFDHQSYTKHTTCISEAEKYQGALYQGKKVKTPNNNNSNSSTSTIKNSKSAPSADSESKESPVASADSPVEKSKKRKILEVNEETSKSSQNEKNNKQEKKKEKQSENEKKQETEKEKQKMQENEKKNANERGKEKEKEITSGEIDNLIEKLFEDSNSSDSSSSSSFISVRRLLTRFRRLSSSADFSSFLSSNSHRLEIRLRK